MGINLLQPRSLFSRITDAMERAHRREDTCWLYGYHAGSSPEAVYFFNRARAFETAWFRLSRARSALRVLS